MRLISLILISCLLSNIALADCPNAIDLKVGDTVQDCDRVGLSKTRALEVENTLKQGKINLKIIDTQTDLLKWKDTKITTVTQERDEYKNDDQRERQETDRLRNEGSTKLIIGVVVGVVGMFLAARAWGWAAGR